MTTPECQRLFGDPARSCSRARDRFSKGNEDEAGVLLGFASLSPTHIGLGQDNEP